MKREHSLKELIDTGHISPAVIALLQTSLPDIIAEMEETGKYRKLGANRIIISADEKELRIQSENECGDADPIGDYGHLLRLALNAVPARMRRLEKVANLCADPERKPANAAELRLAIERETSKSVYLAITATVIALCILLFLLNRIAKNQGFPF